MLLSSTILFECVQFHRCARRVAWTFGILLFFYFFIANSPNRDPKLPLRYAKAPAVSLSASFTQGDSLSVDSPSLAGVWQGLRYARFVFAVIDEGLGPESTAVCRPNILSSFREVGIKRAGSDG